MTKHASRSMPHQCFTKRESQSGVSGGQPAGDLKSRASTVSNFYSKEVLLYGTIAVDLKGRERQWMDYIGLLVLILHLRGNPVKQIS
jgi:hypothetical protein